MKSLPEKPSLREVFRCLYPHLRKEWLGFAILGAFLGLWLITVILRNYSLRYLLDDLAQGRDSWSPWLYLSSFLTGMMAIRLWQWGKNVHLEPSLKTTLNYESARSFLSLSLDQHHRFSSGGLAHKSLDVGQSTVDLIDSTLECSKQIISIFFSLTICFLFYAPVGFYLLCWLFFSIFLLLIRSRVIGPLASEVAQTQSRLSGSLVDVFSHHMTVKLFAQQDGELNLLKKHQKEAKICQQNLAKKNIKIFALISTLLFAMITISLVLMVEAYKAKILTLGAMAAIFAAFLNIIDSFYQCIHSTMRFFQNVGKLQEICIPLLIKPEIQDLPSAKTLEISQGEISFEKVNFHYKDKPSIFENLSFKIYPKEKVGLVGYSGSGKSTIVHLLLRFYEPSQGKILIDHQDIRDTIQTSLRNQIALITQDVSLFHRSIYENITYGLQKISMEDVIEAAKVAHIHEMIMSLPQGYQTPVGERGARLSGGQRQRVALARALLKKAPILIMDEATSHLDSLTESYIQKSLPRVMEPSTCLIIAHRLSTLMDLDRILVIDEGQIVQNGSHESLLKEKGLYKKMWEAQIGGFLPDKRPSVSP